MVRSFSGVFLCRGHHAKERGPITNFDFHTNTIRVVDLDGEPWFHSADVLHALEYPKHSHANIRLKLSPDEIGVHSFHTKMGPRAGKIVSESGLYKIIMRSDKPQARQFQDWVTRVVLPSIRKDGGYILGEEKVATGQMSGTHASASCAPARFPPHP